MENMYTVRGKLCSSNEISKMELTSHSYSDVIVKNFHCCGVV